jgi:phosphonate transport system permease protein
MKKEVFKTEGLQFAYPESETPAITTEAFSIYANDSIAIIGSSGGGKSTLLRLIEGSLIAENLRSQKIFGPTALIYQDLRLVNERSALENCLMGAFGQKQLTQSQKSDFAYNLLEQLGLSAHSHQAVSMLSGGQKQRVAIARALMSRPKLLLADEPFSHLDYKTAVETYNIIKKLQNEFDFALVVSIHHNEFMPFKFDQTWIVSQGHLYFSPDSIVNNNLKVLTKKPSFFISETFFILFFSLLTIICLIQLPQSGFNSQNAWGELVLFFKKLVINSLAQLSTINWNFLIGRLMQTLQMALLGTVFGFIIACPLGFLSADGISSRWINRPIRFFLMILRSIPALLWALFFVSSLGLGVVSGVAALSVYSIGYFAKLLYEGIEDLERKPFMALRQLGASRWQAARHALLPSSKPLLVSSFIFLLEYNVRSASLLGLVGAGGLGQDLMYFIEWRDFSSVFAILLLLISVVLSFDQISKFIRLEIKKRRGL